MLNRAKLLQKIEKLTDTLFVDRSREYSAVIAAWKALSADPTFADRAHAVDAPWPLPTWDGNPNQAIDIRPAGSYEIVSVDGSQVYPDRHQGTACFLINVGTVILRYGMPGRRVTFDSLPHLFAGDLPVVGGLDLSPDMVNALRQEYELRAGLENAIATRGNHASSQLLLFDGSLIFWNLEAKDKRFRDVFLPRYLDTLEQLYQHQIATASYISLPKSKELINLVRLQLCDFNPKDTACYASADFFVDATLARTFLAPGQCSTIFQNHAPISSHYPPHLRPHFFYLHNGDEIGRVELPAWAAQDGNMADTIASIVLDQCIKGHGYPVVLAEAHEQAVVKGPDREFFYQLLAKIGSDRGHHRAISLKSAHKRRMSI